MAKDLFTELGKLKKNILYLGSMVEENVRQAVKAFTENDVDLAKKIESHDDEVDRTEIKVEEHCLKILALHQPVAGDLRFVVTVLKINNDLERIGDLAVKIAKKVIISNRSDTIRFLANRQSIPEEFNKMFDRTIWILTKAIDAFVNEDADLAYKVCIWDDEVDESKNKIRKELEELINKEPSQHIYLSMLLSVSRSLERIADHATNIAEDVIYMLQGRIVRHDAEEFS